MHLSALIALSYGAVVLRVSRDRIPPREPFPFPPPFLSHSLPVISLLSCQGKMQKRQKNKSVYDSFGWLPGDVFHNKSLHGQNQYLYWSSKMGLNNAYTILTFKYVFSIKRLFKFLKENATVFPYSNMFFPQLRRVDMYLSRLSPCT